MTELEHMAVELPQYPFAMPRHEQGDGGLGLKVL
jgi:hypothetical protein